MVCRIYLIVSPLLFIYRGTFMKVKNSYELKEITETIKKENPDLSEKEIERKKQKVN